MDLNCAVTKCAVPFLLIELLYILSCQVEDKRNYISKILLTFLTFLLFVGLNVPLCCLGLSPNENSS